jgi:PAS domain S-box-containing protein
LTYEVMLAELGENLIKASSAAEAFAILLKADLRGYISGAVDYVTAPVVPEVLRAKVKVFADLYRKQRELESLKGELEARVDERTAELAAFTARLAKSEERLRLAQEAGEVGIWDWNLITGVLYCSRKLKSLFGLGHDVSPTPELFLEMVHPNDRAAVRNAVRVAIGGQQPFRLEFRLKRPDGHEVWIGSRGEVRTGPDGKSARLIGIVVDITERKEGEARQSVLIHELKHPTKNLLAVFQSIVTNMLANSRDLTGAKAVMVRRLHALARAQDFITAGSTAGVSLRALVEAELSAFATQLKIDGTPLVVGGSFAQQFALVIHELATNAAKYGSLSTPNGRVLVGWKIIHECGEPVLSFYWTERDGPAVSAPTEQGFGSRLIAVASNGECP